MLKMAVCSLLKLLSSIFFQLVSPYTEGAGRISRPNIAVCGLHKPGPAAHRTVSSEVAAIGEVQDDHLIRFRIVNRSFMSAHANAVALTLTFIRKGRGNAERNASVATLVSEAKVRNQNKKLKRVPLMSAPLAALSEATTFIEPSKISDRKAAAIALAIVRDGVITGEGPTTKGRVHFSRALDAEDVAWCARILTAAAVQHQPVSRAEAEALFEIAGAATERSDNGCFDELLAKAVVHHAASVSGLPVPPRSVALSADTAIESWSPPHAIGIEVEVLNWITAQMRGKRRRNGKLAALVATVLGAALPLAQLPNVFDIGT